MIENLLFEMMTYWAPFALIGGFSIIAWKLKSKLLGLFVFGNVVVQIATWFPHSIVEYGDNGEIIGTSEANTLELVLQYVQWSGALLALVSLVLFAIILKPVKAC